MESLFTHLGIDWKLLLAQGVNFFVLVILLRYFFYGPLVSLLNSRRRRIEDGLENADEAEERLKEIEDLKNQEVLKGEKRAMAIIDGANKEGEENKKKIISRAEREAEEIKKKTEELRRRLIQRESEELESRAREIIKEAIFTSVGLHPEEVDRKLVDDAVAGVKKLRI